MTLYIPAVSSSVSANEFFRCAHVSSAIPQAQNARMLCVSTT